MQRKGYFSPTEHGNGDCGQALCVGWHRTEVSLGLPEDWKARKIWYKSRLVEYASWQKATFCPNWTLAEGKCHNCKAETLVVRAAEVNLCVMWCLNTGVPYYPTGEQHPHAKDFVTHAKNCKKPDASTLHSFSLTSKYLEGLKTAFTFSNLKDGKERYKSTSYSNGKENQSKRLSSASHLPNLVLSPRPSLDSNTQKNSNSAGQTATHR